MGIANFAIDGERLVKLEGTVRPIRNELADVVDAD